MLTPITQPRIHHQDSFVRFYPLARAERDRDEYKSKAEKLQTTLNVKLEGHYNFDELADILFASGDPFDALSLANRLWALWRDAWEKEYAAKADAADADEGDDDADSDDNRQSSTGPHGSAPLSKEHPTIRRLRKTLRTALHPDTSEGEIILTVMTARKLIAACEGMVDSSPAGVDKTDVVLRTMDLLELLKTDTQETPDADQPH
jgi:hypothetical protein